MSKTLKHPPGLPPVGLFQKSIWSTPNFSLIPPNTSKEIKIAIEGLPCERLNQVLIVLKELGYRVFNHEINWQQLYAETPDNHIFPYFMNQMVQNSQKPKFNQMGFRLYNNCYGLLPIWLEWLNREQIITETQYKLLKSCAGQLLEPPDYIIYLYCPPQLVSIPPYNSEQIENIYAEYEWILDNAHCPYPLFKVSLMESPKEVVETILVILRQIVERINLKVDESEED